MWATENIDFPTSSTQLVFADTLVSSVVSIRICDGEIKSHVYLEEENKIQYYSNFISYPAVQQ